MSDSSKKERIVGVELKLAKCEHGNLHVTDVRLLDDVAVVYDAPDADAVLASSTFGWSTAPSWDRNWDQTFGDDALN